MHNYLNTCVLGECECIHIPARVYVCARVCGVIRYKGYKGYKGYRKSTSKAAEYDIFVVSLLRCACMCA